MLRILFSEPNPSARGPAIFVDRDGVINCRRPGDYVLDWSQFVFVPGIRTALKQLSSLQLPMIVISNQAAVGKGLLDSARLEEITAQMQQALSADGTSLDAAYYCIHRAEDKCLCRKPKPGLLLKAAADFNIHLPRSVFIGDSESDVQAALAAGCAPVFLRSDFQPGSDSPVFKPTPALAMTAQGLFKVVKECLQDAAKSSGYDKSKWGFGRDA